MDALPGKALRQLFLLLIIGALLALLFLQLKFFLPAFLGAYTLYVLLRKPLFFLVSQKKWNPKLAAATLLLCSIILVLLPVNAVFQILVSRILPALEHSPEVLSTIEKIVHELEAKYHITVLTPEMLQKMTNWGVTELSGAVSASLAGILSLLVAYFILWFMLAEGQQMERRFFEWLPLRPESEQYVRERLHDLVVSNALGIPLMGIVQGLFGLIAYLVVGIQEPVMWFVITMLAGMLPVFGVALAYIPLSLIEMANGHPGVATFILLYGFIVLGSVDNIARMWVLKKIGNAHPLVTLFGVIAGLKLFGFIGFVFGPIMVSMLILLFQLYGKEFGAREKIILPEE